MHARDFGGRSRPFDFWTSRFFLILLFIFLLAKRRSFYTVRFDGEQGSVMTLAGFWSSQVASLIPFWFRLLIFFYIQLSRVGTLCSKGEKREREQKRSGSSAEQVWWTIIGTSAETRQRRSII